MGIKNPDHYICSDPEVIKDIILILSYTFYRALFFKHVVFWEVLYFAATFREIPLLCNIFPGNFICFLNHGVCSRFADLHKFHDPHSDAGYHDHQR